MPAHPAPPPDAAYAVDPVAVAVIDDALKLRASHSAAPTLDILDVVLQGRRARPIDFGEVSPVSPFGLLVVEAFDRGMPVCDWIGFYRYPDPRVIAALDDVWRKEVWPAFTAHFGIAWEARPTSEVAASVRAETRRKQLRDPAFFLDFIA